MITAALPDELTLHEAAQLASAQHLHLVIDYRHGAGEVKITPQIFPGMVKIAVADRGAWRERRAA